MADSALERYLKDKRLQDTQPGKNKDIEEIKQSFLVMIVLPYLVDLFQFFRKNYRFYPNLLQPQLFQLVDNLL